MIVAYIFIIALTHDSLRWILKKIGVQASCHMTWPTSYQAQLLRVQPPSFRMSSSHIWWVQNPQCFFLAIVEVAKYRYLHPAKLQQQRLPAIYTFAFQFGLWTLECVDGQVLPPKHRCFYPIGWPWNMANITSRCRRCHSCSSPGLVTSCFCLDPLLIWSFPLLFSSL